MSEKTSRKKNVRLVKCEPISRRPDGTLVFDACADAANADWIRAARLKRRADQGDEEAARELERLENTPMYKAVEAEEPEPSQD